ncbi:MAG: hypothetical protein ACK56F_10175, partial [bacterium]
MFARSQPYPVVPGTDVRAEGAIRCGSVEPLDHHVVELNRAAVALQRDRPFLRDTRQLRIDDHVLAVVPH